MVVSQTKAATLLLRVATLEGWVIGMTKILIADDHEVV